MVAWLVAQKLPKPCVGYTAVAASSSLARRWAERYWARVNSSARSSPSRSLRPVAP